MKFNPQCCNGVAEDGKINPKGNKFCVPMGFDSVQIGTNNYQGLIMNCPPSGIGGNLHYVAETQASKLLNSF